MIHSLKTWSSHWLAIQAGTKTCEVRRNDRDFAIGDVLLLRRWDPGEGNYIRAEPDSFGHMRTSQAMFAETLERVVTSILHGGQFGIEPGYCVLSITKVPCVDEALARMEAAGAGAEPPGGGA